MSIRVWAWLSKHIYIKQCQIITHPCPNFNNGSIEMKTWLNNHISYKTVDMITYPWPDLRQIMSVKWAADRLYWFPLLPQRSLFWKHLLRRNTRTGSFVHCGVHINFNVPVSSLIFHIKIYSVLLVAKFHPHVKFQSFIPCILPRIPRNPKFDRQTDGRRDGRTNGRAKGQMVWHGVFSRAACRKY